VIVVPTPVEVVRKRDYRRDEFGCPKAHSASCSRSTT
jgi:hypothetical protein